MALSRGSGHIDGSRLVLQATDETSLAIVSLDADALEASGYRRIRWTLSGMQSGVVLSALWRSDLATGKINTALLESSDEGAQVLLTPGERNWAGRIGGLALGVRGSLREPLIIEQVSVDPMDAADVVADRLHDWLAYRPWNGLSINTALGGPLDQPLWLPLAVALIALTAIALCVAWQHRPRAIAPRPLSLIVFAIVSGAWITLDARWLWVRLQQTEATAAIFSGKPSREKHTADLDGYVYAFAEQVGARLPKTPARVYVTGDEHYFTGRLAYHLYPHNVYLDHVGRTLPPSASYKPGEYIVVFRRRGVRYDPALQLLYVDDQPPLHAQVLLAHLGNAMFRLL